jgi:hypothetical protein
MQSLISGVKWVDKLDERILKVIGDAENHMEDRTAPKICKAMFKYINTPKEIMGHEEFQRHLSSIRYRLSKLERSGTITKQKVMNAWVYDIV